MRMRPMTGAMALTALVAFAPGAGADEITDDFEVPVPAEAPREPTPVAQCPECPEGPNLGRVSFNAGMDVVTRYYFRGILQEDEGFIGQPYMEVNFNLYEDDDFSATLIGGIWNSLHSEHTLASGDPEAWYEFDAYGGLGLGLGMVDFTTLWTTYLSPSGAFDEINDIQFSLGLDDSDWLGNFAMSPTLNFIKEVKGQADAGDAKGTALQIMGGPEFPLTAGDDPITVGIPLELGLSLDQYYQDPAGSNDSTFGYFLTGLDFGFPLSFVPKEYGSWLLSAGARFISLGRSTRAFNRGSTFLIDGERGDDYSFFGVFGLSMTY
jgi:hypothetical protein